VWALAVLPGGLLASAGVDAIVRLWDVSTGTATMMPRVHTDSVFALAVTSDGVLASGSRDTTVVLARGDGATTLAGHTHTVWALAALPGGRLASGSQDTTVVVWSRPLAAKRPCM
jgi:WD40 repeat protein